MQVPHTEPNTAFSSVKVRSDEWIEVFFSRPSWGVCQIAYSVDDGRTWVPFGQYRLIDASHIRKAFRSFRIRAPRLLFKLADGAQTHIDDNHGKHYRIEASGRYVVEASAPDGMRRVSDVQIADVLRPHHPRDSTIDLIFSPAATASIASPPMSWRNAFVVYFPVTPTDSLSFSPASIKHWFTLPMNKSAVHHHSTQSAWVISINAKFGIDCAFNDGGSNWDCNNSLNYKIRLPGTYHVGDGYLQYKGVSRADIHDD